MPRGLPQIVRDNIEKCQVSTLAAVEAYNRPGKRFRTAQYLVMIVIAWAALFHAIFFRRNIKPWYKSKNGHYERVDGEPRYWDLSKCIKEYYNGNSPPVRKNLEFLITLRNKIEHRHLPELDASLYGECQAALLNLEELLVQTFGQKYALQEQLAISLQFSRLIPDEKKNAARILANDAAKTVAEYIEKFRGSLASTTLNSMQYSFNVFLVPKVSNREKAADAAVQFIRVDEASEEELERLGKLNVLIKEKNIPIQNLDLYKPGEVIEKVNSESIYKMTTHGHTSAWKHYSVRPKTGSKDPKKCVTEYCVYDKAHNDYLYTNAWVKKCVEAFSSYDVVKQVLGREPNAN